MSLEELLLVIEVGFDASTAASNSCFEVREINMEGAAWDLKKKELTMTDELSVALPPIRLHWSHKDSADVKQAADRLRVPVYLNTSRSVLICAFNVQAPKEPSCAVWFQRSVCLTLWTKP